MGYEKLYWACVLLARWGGGGAAPPGDRIVFPGEPRQERRIQEVITPPVLPVIPHLENDPSTLLPGELPRSSRPRMPAAGGGRGGGGEDGGEGAVKPRFGLSHGFDVSPNSDGGVTASFSHGFSGLGGHSQAAAHSFSVGFNNGFQASQSASQAGSFNNNGFLSSSFSGSQASSQSSSFSSGAGGGGGGISASAASSSASVGGGLSSAHSQSAGFGTSFGGNSAVGSQSASSAFGSGSSLSNAIGSAISGSNEQSNFGEGVLDIRHRAGNVQRGVATSIVFPGETSRQGHRRDRPKQFSNENNRWRGGSSTYRSNDDGDWFAILVSD